MNPKELAFEVYVGREKASKRIESGKARKEVVEKLVLQILEIFKISNESETSTVLVWGVKIIKSQNRNDEYCWLPLLSFEPNKSEFKNKEVFGYNCDILGDNTTLVEHIKEMKIPSRYHEEIANYFHIHLSDYFDVTEEIESWTKVLCIKLKVRNISEEK